MPRKGSSVASDVLHPGRAKQTRVFGPVRNPYVSSGIYRPSNRWRSQTGSHQLQRAQHLADRLPRLTKYNHARS